MRALGLIVGTTLTIALVAPPPAIAGTNRADEAVRSDLRAIATQMETFLTDQSRYPTGADVNYDGLRTLMFLDAYETRLHAGNRLRAIKLTEDGLSYCLKVTRRDGATSTTKNWRVISDRAGFLGTGPCPERFVVTSFPVPR